MRVVDPRDPWGLGHLMALQGQRPPVYMPPMHTSRTIYTDPHVRQLVQFILHHHYGR
jgi:hypothetical protein